jgi:hypothetical protein
MQWFRVHSNLLNNPKFQNLSESLRARLLNIWCLANEGDGLLPDVAAIAWRFRLTEKETRSTIADLKAAGFLDETDDGLAPHDWNEHQFKQGSAAERIKRYRDRLKSSGTSAYNYLKHKDAVFERDDYRCVYCGSGETLCVDHVVPIVRGGDDDPLNLATACKKCNSGKAGRTPEEAGYSIRKDADYATLYHQNATRLREKVVLPDTPSEQIQSRAETEQILPNAHAKPQLIPPLAGSTSEPPLPPALFAAFERCRDLHPNCTDPDAALRDFLRLFWKGEITEADANAIHGGMRKWLDSEVWSEGQGRFSAEWRKFSAWISGKAWLANPAPSVAAKQAGSSGKRSSDGIDPNAEFVAPWKTVGGAA